MTLFAVGAFESLISTVSSAREWDICDAVNLLVFISSEIKKTFSFVPCQTAFFISLPRAVIELLSLLMSYEIVSRKPKYTEEIQMLTYAVNSSFCKWILIHLVFCSIYLRITTSLALWNELILT